MPDAALSLQACGLSCSRRGRLLFSGLSFSLQPGQLLQVEGANGAGKTTLLKLMAGLSRPGAGQVRWGGQPLPAAAPLLHRQLAYLGHRHALKGVLSPLENLRWSLALMGTGFRETDAIAVLAGLDLAHAIDQPCHTLSAGQQRRVALARVLLSVRPLWILDEPLTALDRHVVPRVLQSLRDHAAAGGLVLLTAHQPLALGPAHRSLHLAGGDGDA